MLHIQQTKRVTNALERALNYCADYRHEFVRPEHLLRALLDDVCFVDAVSNFDRSGNMQSELDALFLFEDPVPENIDYRPEFSEQMSRVMEYSVTDAVNGDDVEMDLWHLTKGILALKDSWAGYILGRSIGKEQQEFIYALRNYCMQFDNGDYDSDDGYAPQDSAPESWRSQLVCMNDLYKTQNPLIGREEELERTMQVLCRREKNNPLHVGEPGVGKTALVWGLVERIVREQVPDRLKGSRVYLLDMGSLVAGTQYRGDFEKRLKKMLEGIRAEGSNNIVYIDEIHTLVGAGATGEGAMDASNMLKPYLEEGTIRFIGSTTYEEYNRHFSRSRGLVRRFQQIDIKEPSVEDTKNIIRQLLPRYEEFHGVRYLPEAVSFAVEASARHVPDRRLPDKAIDLIDEAGAAMEMQRTRRDIGKPEIAQVLAKICKVESLADSSEEDFRTLQTLEQRMKSAIYGQDEAIRLVSEAIQMSRAGLLDDGKPLASLLFVGPTGVGKTEVARVLARELGIELLRFDMSEYAEKHTVAKLIGSPAGYVGYEDGGLLTDAVRRAPNCVLLLDEIEKAHQDIYNILLQVMDYAQLTDNKGRKADFRNVVLIMTSNAGAQFASRASIGFSGSVSRGEAMMKEIRKLFKPEFLNRLSGTVVFRDMDMQMATMILQKKLGELEQKLSARKVAMTVTAPAFDYLLKEGYTPEYGAREMDRVIAQKLKPILMRALLFGKLKDGGKAEICMREGSLSLG